MKNFFTSVLGALVALMIFVGGSALVLFVVVAVIGVASSKNKTLTIENGSYLVFDLSAQITDAPPKGSVSQALSSFGEEEGRPEEYQLRNVTRAIRRAAADKRIAGIFLHGQMPSGAYSNGFAQLQEVRAALAHFKLAQKPVVAYLEFAGTRDVYLASIADELTIDPYGVMAIPGLAMQPVFLAGAFEKLGIGVQVTRVGKYKSAIEPFTRKDMSPENREQAQKLIDDVWSEFVKDCSVARGLTPAALQAIVDKEGLVRADTALAAGLVTRVAYRDEVLEELKERTGQKGFNEPFKQVSLADYIERGGARKPVKSGDGGQIAVVYAQGPIVDGHGQPGEIGGVRFARELRRLRQDESVKAIVLRVNSPGGSASASENIQREIRLARKAKPVVVSMGTYAASGGYWISAYADRIYAEPTTITGSIGVFGMLANYQKLANNLGITFDVVKTGRFADAMSGSRPKTEEELALVQRMVDWIYGEFVGKVVEARGLERAHVEEIAQGRVWSGLEALKLGLVDEIGGLDAAVRFAAEKAGLGEKFRVEEYPARKDFMEALSEMLAGVKPPSTRGAAYELIEQLKNEAKLLEQFNDPAGIYARLPLELQMK